MTSIKETFSLEIPITQDGISAIDWLAQQCPLSKQKLKDAMNKGAVWLQQGKPINRIRRARKILQPGHSLFLYYNPQVLEQEPPAASLIKDNTHYSVWYKPSGMFSHGSKWGDHCSITRWIEQHHIPQRQCFLVHRLDRAASGLLLIGHDKPSTAKLCQLFEQRRIEKRYQAIVYGEFPQNEQRITTPIDGKIAVSNIQRLHYQIEKNQSLVEVQIETGRKHQIRRHLAEMGHTIVGDRQYGQQLSAQHIDLQLRCSKLSFICPISNDNKEFVLTPDQLLNLST